MKHFFNQINFTGFVGTALIAILVLVFNSTHAQTGVLVPPARVYHVNEAGEETKVVKERWMEDENGEKNGKYIRYGTDGKVRENATYVHGSKTGPAFYIGDLSSSVRYNLHKFVGSYTNGNKTGVWNVYNRRDNSLEEKQWYNAEGKMIKRSIYDKGKIMSTTSFENNIRSGPARVYGDVETEYASGIYEKGNAAGTWVNTAFEDRKLLYKKGCKVVFEDGVAVTTIDAAGATRSLKAEAQQRESAQQEATLSAAQEQKLQEPILTHGITFCANSYALNEQGIIALYNIAERINDKVGSAYQVKEITLSVHAGKPTDVSSGTVTIRDTINYILTLNRSYTIRNYLKSMLKDKSVSFTSYGCGSGLSLNYADQIRGRNAGIFDYDRAIMTFDEDLPNARRVYIENMTRFGIIVANVIVPNVKMKEFILSSIHDIYNDDIYRSRYIRLSELYLKGTPKQEKLYSYEIPPEFWLENLKESVPPGYATTENVKQFKDAVESTIKQLSGKYGSNINAGAFFSNELMELTKTASPSSNIAK